MNVNVQAIMNPNVKFAGVEARVSDVARIMAENDCGSVPIVDDKMNVLGIITDRDICLAMAYANHPPSEIPVRQVMSSNVFCCSPDDDLVAALRTMQEKGVHRLPVVGEDGKLRGILSMRDMFIP